MSEVTMTMQEALAKKKILESDIAKRLSSNSLYGNKIYYISYATETAKTIKGVDRDEFEERMEANYTSVKHLISNLARLKVAINASNATTKITVAGKEYTVADAIARFRSLDTEKGFFSTCASQYNNAVKHVQETNDTVNDPQQIADYVSKSLQSESAKKNEALYKQVVEDYKKNNIVYLVDPNNLGDELGGWQDELIAFEAEIHTALVTSNVSTRITVEFED